MLDYINGTEISLQSRTKEKKFTILTDNVNNSFLIFVCYTFQKWYALSKTLAEDAARNFLKEHDIKLIVINPAMSIGPLLQPEVNASSSTILNLINGNIYLLNHSSLLILSKTNNKKKTKLCSFSQNMNSFTWLMQVQKRFQISVLGGSM